MKKIMMVCGLAVCLPLAALAEDVIDQELNGLDIGVNIIGPSSNPGSGPGASGGVQVVMVTNHSDSVVSCRLQPGPSETMTEPAAVSIKPGEDASLPLEGDYSSASPRIKLVCTPD